MSNHRVVRTSALVAGAVVVGVLIGWVGRGRQPAPGWVGGAAGRPTYTDHAAQTAPGAEPTLAEPAATGEALDPDIDADPAIIPGDVRGGNVADQGWNSGPTRRGPS